MNYKEKVKWLKETKELLNEGPLCDAFYVDLVHIRDEVFDYETKKFNNIVRSVSNNLVIMNYIDDIKLDFMEDDMIDYLEVRQMLCTENIRSLCREANDFYFKDRIKSKYEYLKDNDESEDIILGLAILDNKVLEILDFGDEEKTHIMRLK
jgi:hypothetical protein